MEEIKLYQAMKAAAKRRKIKASPEHDLYRKVDPYFFHAFYCEDYQHESAGEISMILNISVKYHRYDELQYGILNPGSTFKFTDKIRANSTAECHAAFPEMVRAFPFDGTEEALPGLCEDILDFLEVYCRNFLTMVEGEYGDLGSYYIAHKETLPRLAGLAYLEKGNLMGAAGCFASADMDGENLIWSVTIHTEEELRRAKASGKQIFSWEGRTSMERNQKEQFADYAVALRNGLAWTRDMALFGLLPEERERR